MANLEGDINEIIRINRDYEEKSVNTIFYDNDRRQACVKSAFRLDLYITVTKLHVKSECVKNFL